MKDTASLVTTAYTAIYRKIVGLEYQPGQRLSEKLLITDLDIGRTPIREALRSLESDMLVESQPKKGVVVRPITLQNTKAVFTALTILETGVAELAVLGDHLLEIEAMNEANHRLAKAVDALDVFTLVDSNNDFHAAFSRCSANIYIIEALRKTRCEANRLAYLSFANEIGPEQPLRNHYNQVIEQHQAMIDCIKKRDGTALKEITLAHIAVFKQRIVNYLAS